MANTHYGDAERYTFNKRCARQALDTIDRFLNRVPSDAKAEIESQRSELARIIAELA